MFFLLIVLIVFGSRPPLRRFMADASVAVAVVAADLQEVYLFIYFHFVALRHLTPLAVSFVWLFSCLISPALFYSFYFLNASPLSTLVSSSECSENISPFSVWFVSHLNLFGVISLSSSVSAPVHLSLISTSIFSLSAFSYKGGGKKRISLHLLAWQTCKDSTLPNIFNRFLIGTP